MDRAADAQLQQLLLAICTRRSAACHLALTLGRRIFPPGRSRPRPAIHHHHHDCLLAGGPEIRLDPADTDAKQYPSSLSLGAALIVTCGFFAGVLLDPNHASSASSQAVASSRSASLGIAFGALSSVMSACHAVLIKRGLVSCWDCITIASLTPGVRAGLAGCFGLLQQHHVDDRARARRVPYGRGARSDASVDGRSEDILLGSADHGE